MPLAPCLVPAAVGAEGVEADHVDRDDQQRPERVGRDEGHLRYGVEREHRHAEPPGELVTDHDPESGQQLKRTENQYRPAPGAQVTDDKAGARDEETRLRDGGNAVEKIEQSEDTEEHGGEYQQATTAIPAVRGRGAMPG